MAKLYFKYGNEFLELSAYCNFCQEPFEHRAKYYISTGYANDPYLFTLRKEGSVGGMAIEYCPLCGRKLECENIREE